MSIFNDHRKLYPIAGLLFLTLTFFTAIWPALQNQKNNAPLPDSEPLAGDALLGKNIYISEGCVGCHSQQVRNVEMDRVFGSRPGMAADYANIGRTSVWVNTATVMGTERTGPDLIDVGSRQPSREWNLMHLFNPRSVVAQSIMPSYEWMFEMKEQPGPNDVVVNVAPEFLKGRKGKVVARPEALQLVAYLQSLKQVPLPDGTQPNKFLYGKDENQTEPANSGATKEVSGKSLYGVNCQSCHQPNGEGLPGAFPPLKGSTIVDGENLELYVDIIMNGYDARPEYGVMPAIGSTMHFDEHKVAAIINYERSAWGNKGKQVTPEEVKKIMEFINQKISASNTK
jgi:cytochrome c oxidase cbb3-type subunit 2